MLFKYIITVCGCSHMSYKRTIYTRQPNPCYTKVPNAEPMGYMFQSTNVHVRLRYICEVPEYRNISLASAFVLWYGISTTLFIVFVHILVYLVADTFMLFYIFFERCLRWETASFSIQFYWTKPIQFYKCTLKFRRDSRCRIFVYMYS